MDLAVLWNEINTDPAGLGYAGKTNAQIAALLNAATVSVERATVSGYEVFECIVPAEWAALTAQEKSRVQLILAMGTVNLQGTNTRASLGATFGAGTATRTALLALQNQTVARTQYLGIGSVTPGDVQRAKAYGQGV